MKPIKTAAHVSDTDLSDEALIRRFQAERDEAAFTALVHRYQHPLFSSLRRRLGHHEMAEEAFQETFLSVSRHADQFDVTRPFRPWLFAIAANQACTIQRRRARERLLRGAGHAGESRAAPDAMSIETMAVAGGPSTDDLAASREASGLVRAALLRLTEPQRRVIDLIFNAGYKYREAAEVLGIPVGTVKSRLHAAIQRVAGIILNAGGSAGIGRHLESW